MTRPRKRGRLSGTAWGVWAPVIVLSAAGILLALPFVGPAPPSRLVLATGSPGGAYHRFGERYAQALAADGVDVELRTTEGSVVNVALLLSGAADVAFVQSGTVPDEAVPELTGIASLYYEPVWIFHRIELPIERLAGLAGYRVAIGPEGSGTRAIALQMLAVNDLDDTNTTLLALTPEVATTELLASRIDALLLVSAPDSEAIHRLMEADGTSVKLLAEERSESYAQRFRELRPVVLRRGVLDFAADVPRRDVPLVSPTASLVARDDLHSALMPLFIDAARTLHGRGGLFEAEGEFPSPYGLDVPVAADTAHYYVSGPGVLFRWLPFRVAATLDRLKIMLLPLLTLLFPLSRVAPPLYRWRIRRKIYRWYRVLLDVESAEHDAEGDARRAAVVQRIEDEIGLVRVPASYGEELYNLRMHLELVRARLEKGRDAAG